MTLLLSSFSLEYYSHSYPKNYQVLLRILLLLSRQQFTLLSSNRKVPRLTWLSVGWGTFSAERRKEKKKRNKERKKKGGKRPMQCSSFFDGWMIIIIIRHLFKEFKLKIRFSSWWMIPLSFADRVWVSKPSLAGEWNEWIAEIYWAEGYQQQRISIRRHAEERKQKGGRKSPTHPFTATLRISTLVKNTRRWWS